MTIHQRGCFPLSRSTTTLTIEGFMYDRRCIKVGSFTTTRVHKSYDPRIPSFTRSPKLYCQIDVHFRSRWARSRPDSRRQLALVTTAPWDHDVAVFILSCPFSYRHSQLNWHRLPFFAAASPLPTCQIYSRASAWTWSAYSTCYLSALACYCCSK